MDPKEAVEVLRVDSSRHRSVGGGESPVADAIDAVLAALEQAQRELAGDAMQAETENVALRAEVERLKQDAADAMALVLSHEGHITSLKKQESDQRAEAKRLAALVQEYATRVAALMGALDRIANPQTPDNLGEPLSRLILAQEIARRTLFRARAEAGGGER